MKNFDITKPDSINQAFEIAKSSESNQYLAGGQTLIPTLKFDLNDSDNLIDLSNVRELNGVCENSDDGVVIGAMTSHATVAASSLVMDKIPSLADLASNIGDRMVRNMGTIGGSLANNDPSADYPASILALDSKIKTNLREIISTEFITGMYETCLEPHELIQSISFQIPEKSIYLKFKNPASRYAIVGFYLSVFKNNKILTGITGASSYAQRCVPLEKALENNFDVSSIPDKVLDDYLSDLHASSAYREHILKTLIKRAILKLS